MYNVFHFWTGILRLSSDFSSQCFDKYELNRTFQDKTCRKSLFTLFAACGTDSELPFYGVILYAQ